MMKQYLRANWPEFSPYIDKLDIVELSDIFRYAVVYDQGGVWTDSDVDLKKPLDQWVRPAARGADLLSRRAAGWRAAVSRSCGR